MTRPKLLDLYCCECGAGEGYRRAGWDVLGVDLRRRRAACHDVLEADVLKLPLSFIRMFDAAHASPPCQFCTAMNNDKSRHHNLIPQTRFLLQSAGLPYVIENVTRARPWLINPVALRGTMFGNQMTTSRGETFVLDRERLFETNWPVRVPEDPGPRGHRIANVVGGHLRCRSGDLRTGKGTGRTVDFPGEDRQALARQLFDMPWASMAGISEAVPPSYTEFIGRQLLERVS